MAIVSSGQITITDLSDGISPTITINPDTSLTIVDAKGTSITPVLKGDEGDQGVQGLQGPAGTQGVAGPKGADGKTQYTHIAYANSVDGVTDFSTSDSNRAYIGMYVDFNIEDSTTPSDYSWTLVKGADGTQGTPGKPGADGKTPYFHTAWSYSADGTDGFTTVYPNLNFLDGTKDFSGDWENNSGWENDGTYKGLTVKKRVWQWGGISKTFTAPKDSTYTFSAYFKSSGNDANITRYASASAGYIVPNKLMGNNFGWTRDSFSVTLKAKDTISARYEITGSGTDSILWTAGHKWEEDSITTPYMQSASEVTTADWPKYIGHYTDFMQADSTNPSDYTWSLMRGNDGERGPQGLKGDPGATGIPGQAGVDGKTSYLHIAYATNSTGTAGFDVSNATGKTYIGQYTDFTSADSTEPSKYTWSLIKGDKGDKGDPGIKGSDGTSGIIVSSVAPDSPQTGQLWQDTSTTPQLVKKWTGSEWVIWELYVENMNVNNLSALSTILGDIDGGTLKLMDDDLFYNGRPKMYGIYQSKLGFISSGPTFETAGSGMISDTQMGVVSVNKGEIRFIVTDYTEDLKTLQESGMSDQDNAFIKFASYEGGNDVMTIGSSGDIVFKGNTSQDTQWITLSSGVKYKYMFSRVYISVDVVGNGSSFMSLGTIPQDYRPSLDQFMVIANLGTGTADDRHIMVRASDGFVILWAPKSGVTYRGEVSFTL